MKDYDGVFSKREEGNPNTESLKLGTYLMKLGILWSQCA